MRRIAIALPLAALALSACDRGRSVPGVPPTVVTVPSGGESASTGGSVTVSLQLCTTCHGDVTRSSENADPLVAAAPPAGTKGEVNASSPAVGAHQAHLTLGSLAGPMACSSCHEIPASTQHPTQRIYFSGIAVLNPPSTGARASYDGARCSNVYCHGSFKNGTLANAPSWTGGPSQAACGSCHAVSPTNGPGGTHPAVAGGDCSVCHTGYTISSVNTATHINGKIDSGCTGCHGDPPPPNPTLPGDPYAGYAHPNNLRCSLCHTGFSDNDGSPQTTGASHQNGVVDFVPLTCTTCHGDPTRTGTDANGQAFAPAPPSDQTGAQSSTVVGAHQAHLTRPGFSVQVACAECHQGHIPSVGSELHADGTVNVAFGALAKTVLPGDTRTMAPAFTPGASPTCSSTYCHGNFKNGNASNAPAWNATSAACGSCHALPPAGTHPVTSASCETCHPGYDPGTSTPDPLTHVNGQVEVNLSCSSCHGDATGTRTPVATATALDFQNKNLVMASPPVDTTGSGSSPAVGAHLAHVNQGDAAAPGALSNALACSSCHVVPTSTSHSNGTVAVTFGGLATAQGAAPAAYSFTTRNCASTYCHGQFVGGKGADTIAWTAAGKLSCTACHLAPPVPAAAAGSTPASYHPNDSTCTDCHPAGYSATTVAAGTHVDGTVTLNANRVGCVQCHGTPGLVANDPATADPNVAGAPPKDSKGNSANTILGVGAHQPHVNHPIAARLSNAIHCTECHGPDKTDRTHADGNSAPIFGTVAKTGGLSPTYSAGTCASTYCHGNFSGGKNASPVWNVPGQLGCAACHLSPPVPAAASGSTPVSYHPNDPTCTDCHPAGYSSTAVVAATHVDGLVTLNANRTGCVSCHGTPGLVANDVTNADPLVAAAPPNDSKGDSANTTLGVGAHAPHVNHALSGRLSYPIKCSECHGANKTDRTHADGNSTPIFGTLARTGGLSPTYSAGTCGSTYCHGNFVGGANASPAWNVPGPLGCNACHGSGTGASALPPGPVSATLHHPQNASCGACHVGYTATTVVAQTHVDGVVQKPTGCAACHGDLTVANAANTDVRSAPAGDANAVDTRGNPPTATSLRGVGAHAAHLTGMTWRSTPIACSECHLVPATGDVSHATGTPVVTFGTLAKTAWSGQPAITPVWNGANNGPTLTCSSVYCHGAFKNGANAALTWAAPTNVVCGTCHAVSTTNGPGGTHPTLTAGQNCGTCHGGTYTNTSVDPALHMNGVLDGGGEPAAAGAGNLCGGCHGGVFAGMNGGTAAVSRHTLGSVSGTNDASTDTNTTWPTGGGLAGVAAAQRSCVNMCHDDHPHTLTSPATSTHDNNVYVDAGSQTLRAATSSTSSDKDNTDFVNSGNGGLCLSCHRSPVETAAPVLHPPVSQAAFNASKHNFTSNAQGTWAYQLHDASQFGRNCTKCHASDAEGNTPTFSASGGIQGPHWSPNPSLLAGPINPGATTNVGLPASGFVCYNCHGSTATPANGAQGNRSGKDVLAATQKTYFHPVNLDSKHDTGAEEVQTATNGWNKGVYSGANRHASCIDCHDPHQAGGTLVNRAATATAARNQLAASSPLYGASGIAFTSYPALPATACASGATLPNTCWTTTAAANFSAAPVTATMEYQICFKCHSSFAFGSTTYPTAPTGYASGMQQTDVAAEFSPNNKSGHPVVTGLNNYASSVAPKALVAAQLNAPWSTNMGAQTMLCTDCHNTDSASPAVQGPHGSAVTFLLAGTNRAWPYNVAGATSGTLIRVSTSETGLGTANGLFCRNCHPQPNSTSSNYIHRQFAGQHGSNAIGACVNCHLLVPHGGKVSRLIVTTNAPARYKVGTPNFASFSKAAKDSYTMGTNIKTSCSQHSGGTGGEAW